MENTNSNDQNKIKKLIQNAKIDKKSQKILKCLSTTSLVDIIQIHKWWDEEAEEESELKWKSLEHNSIVFAPKYESHGICIKYKGEDMELNSIQEEIATFWAQLLDNDLSKKEITRRNFIKEFKKELKLEKCELEDFDFTPIYDYLQKTKEKNKTKTIEEKKLDKENKLKITENYGYAIVDGRAEKISNFMVEPPGIFRGRGEHPLSGIIKTRILPEHVTLNIGPDDAIPKCTLPGHSWKEIVNNQEATWLAYYKDNNKDKSNKYIFLAPNSKFKGINDYNKYEKARKLKDTINNIRNDYMLKISDGSNEDRQLGVATYLIDILALRVGNEKGDDEADTVGCCSLRVEHIKLDDDNHIILDFLGKDSMRYYNRVKVDQKVYDNIKKFIRGKNDDDNLFDLINASKLNDYLKSLMPGLSAKVFRTFNASFTLQQELNKIDIKENDDTDIKVEFYNEANKEVAILCNHQKTVSKNFNVQSEKMQLELKDMIDYLVELNEHFKNLCEKKSKKKEKQQNKKAENEELTKQKGKIKKIFPEDKEKTEKYINNLKSKIGKYEKKLKSREELKQVALGTSKLNYMDPRITVGWCKKNEVPIERIFTKSIRDKFPWAMYTKPDFNF